VDTKYEFTFRKAVQLTAPLPIFPTTPHLLAGEHQTNHMAGYNTMHTDVDTKYESTFKRAVQLTAPLATFPTVRRDPDSMTKQQTHIMESEAYEVACQMDVTIKTHLKKVKNADTESVDTDLNKPQKTQVTDRRGNTDDVEMLADSTHQQAMYETYHKKDVDKAYPEKAATPRNITNDGQPNNGMPRQTGAEDVARRPAVPDAASEKGEPKVQKILCQDSINVPDVKVVPDVQDMPNVQDSIDVPNVKVVPDVQNVPYVQDSIDMPETAAHNISNTNSPGDGQTNSWQTRTRRSPCLPPPWERGGPGHN
jgi:hypothetical protein